MQFLSFTAGTLTDNRLNNHYPHFTDGGTETQTSGGIHVSWPPIRCPLTHCHQTSKLFLGEVIQLQSSSAFH